MTRGHFSISMTGFAEFLLMFIRDRSIATNVVRGIRPLRRWYRVPPKTCI